MNEREEVNQGEHKPVSADAAKRAGERPHLRFWRVTSSKTNGFDIAGENLETAIRRNIKLIIRDVFWDRFHGKLLAEASWRPGIMGGIGGVELLLTPISGNKEDFPLSQYVVWIDSPPIDLTETLRFVVEVIGK